MTYTKTIEHSVHPTLRLKLKPPTEQLLQRTEQINNLINELGACDPFVIQNANNYLNEQLEGNSEDVLYINEIKKRLVEYLNEGSKAGIDQTNIYAQLANKLIALSTALEKSVEMYNDVEYERNCANNEIIVSYIKFFLKVYQMKHKNHLRNLEKIEKRTYLVLEQINVINRRNLLRYI